MSKNAYDYITRPVITEKSTIAAEAGKYTFVVPNFANKQSVKSAVEKIFDVKVTKVNIVNVKGKVKRFKGIIGKQIDKKKAIVTLESGQTIDFTGGSK